MDADLTAIAGLTGTSGFLKKTASNTWTLDTNTYLTGITSTMVTNALGYTPADRIHVIYNPSNSGVLVKTNLAATTSTMLEFVIEGNGYSTSTVVFSRVQAYNYPPNDAILSGKAINYGTAFSSFSVFNYNGYIYLWFPWLGDYQTFRVSCFTQLDRYDHVDEITSAGIPSGATRRLDITPNNAYTTANLTKSVLTTLLESSDGYYVKKSGDTMTGALNVTGQITPMSLEFRNMGSSAGNGGYIDFHYNNSSADFTSRIIESASGILSISGGLSLGSTLKLGNGVLSWDGSANAWKLTGNFYATGFISAGGVSSDGGTSGVDLTAVWDNLVANTGEGLNKKIHTAHLPTVTVTGTNISGTATYSGTGGSASTLTLNLTAVDTKYTNGTGISLSGTTFSLDVAGAKTALGLGSNAYTSTAYLPLAGGVMNTAAVISRTGQSVSWYQGRLYPIIKTTSYTGYNAILSMKTTNGSWDLGVYNSDTAYLTYITDENYSAGNNAATYQLTFPKASGTIALTSQIPTNNNRLTNGAGYLTATTAASTYVKFDPGASEQTIKSSISSFVKGVINLWRSSGDHYTFLGFSNGTTETYLGGIGFKSQSDHNLYRKDGSSYYKILDENNYTTYINTTNFPGLNKVGTVTSVAAGTGLSGGTITTSGTISLAASGVTAGTYYKTTVDTYGRVTSGSYANLSAAINGDLTEGSSNPVDTDFYIAQYAGGGTSTTSYHRRPHSALYGYIKGKLDSVYVPLTRTINSKALSANITLTLDDIGNGSTRSLANYLPLTGGTMSGSIIISDYTAFGVADGTFYLGHPSYPLKIRSNGTTQINGNTIWNSGNSNLSTVPWACSTLTASGNIQANAGVTIANNQSYGGLDTGGTRRTLLSLNSSDQVFLAYGASAAGYNTIICGKDISFNYGTSHASGIYLNASGNVGIGTNAPAQKLDLRGNFISVGTNAGYILYPGMASGEALRITTCNTSAVWQANAIFVLTNGNVGIGTSPTYPLHVAGHAAADGFTTTGAYASYLSSAGWYTVYTANGTNATGQAVILQLRRSFNNTSNEAYTISVNVAYNGKVSITQLSGCANTQLISKIRVDYVNSGALTIAVYYSGTANNTIYVSGIGSGVFCAPTAVSSVNGTAVEFTLQPNGVASNSNIVATGAITAGSASDASLKTNIQSLSAEAAKRIVMALNPVTFTWNEKAGELFDQYKGDDLGMIAQEVEPYLPQAVGTIFEKYKRLDYTKVISPLVKVAQDHETRIRQLEAENRELRKQLNMI